MHRPRWVLVAMSGSVAMVFLDQTVVGVALTSIGRDLHMGATGLQWVVTGYIVAFGALVVLGGHLGDRLGHLRTFIAGVALFTCASAVSGLAPNQEVLIGGRVAQGVGAALMQPASMTLVMAAFPAERRGRALAVYYNAAMVMLVAGPVLGGLLTEFASWRWVFIINVPVGLGTIALAVAARPREPALAAPHPEDRLGAALLAVGLGAAVIGLQQGAAWGWAAPDTLGCLVAGAAALAAFVARERRHPHPLLDLSILRDPGFSLDTLVVLVGRFALVGVTIFLAIWLQVDRGFSPLGAGLGLMPVVLTLLIATQIGGGLLDRGGARTPDALGTGAMALGFLLAVPALAAHSYPWLVAPLMLIGAGAGLSIAANTDAVARARVSERGAAAGLIQTARQVGGAVGVPATGAMLAAGMSLGGAFAVTGVLLALTAAAVAAFQPLGRAVEGT